MASSAGLQAAPWSSQRRRRKRITTSDSERSRSLGCLLPCLRLHGEAQPGSILGVALAIDQHQRGPLMVLNDAGDAAEILEKKKRGPVSCLFKTLNLYLIDHLWLIRSNMSSNVTF